MQTSRVFKNTSYQVVTKILTAGTTFLITTVIASYFGASIYGDFTKIITLVSFFYLVVDFGMNAIFLQTEKKDSFSNLLFLRICIAVFLIFAINTALFLLPTQTSSQLGFYPQVRLGILIFSFTLLSQAFLFSANALFQKNLSFNLGTKATVIASIFTTLLVFVFIQKQNSFLLILLSFVIGGFLNAILALYLGRLSLNMSALQKDFIKKLVTQSLPLGLMLLLNLVYFRIDIFILAFFTSSFEVGIYGLAYRFFEFFLTISLFLSNSVYPILLRLKEDREKLKETINKYLWLFIFISIVIVVFSYFFAPVIGYINTDFSLSVLPFRLLIISLPLFFATSILQWALIANNNQRFLLLVYALLAIVNVVLNILFIPRFSYLASAIITGLSEGIVLIVLYLRFQFLTRNNE